MDTKQIAEKLKTLDHTANVNIAADGTTVIASTKTFVLDVDKVNELSKILKGKQLILSRSGAKVRMAIY